MAIELPFLTNRILGLVSHEELLSMTPDLHRVSFALGETVYEQGTRLQYVYFPITCVLSVIKIMENGSAVEVGTVGREGMGASQALFHAEIVPEKTISQIPGVAYRMPIEKFDLHRQRCPQLRAALERFGQTVIHSLSQSVACNRLHNVNARCAKWLLMTRDRVASDQFPMTHEFLSMMLGVNRPTMTLAAGALQDAGLIKYSRGSMRIIDRKGLENSACECYASGVDEVDRLLTLDSAKDA